MAVKKHRYKGELATSIVWSAAPTFEGAVTDRRVKAFRDACMRHRQDAERHVEQELSRKMSLLMKHYGLDDETNMTALAWALAFEHVPGFKILPETKKRGGRKKEWDGLKLQALYDAVHSVKQQHGFRDRTALEFMLNNPQYAKAWKAPPNHKGSNKQWLETLESRLHDAKHYVGFIDSLPRLIESLRVDVPRKKFRKS